MRELELLRHIYAYNPALGADVVVPPGDDMGAVRIGDKLVLVAVDQVADGVHVDCATTPLPLVGRKVMTRNLSDVAAMAAEPIAALATACLPRGFGEDRAKRLFDAMRETAGAYHCPLIGGDISMWDHPLLLTVTILAEPRGLGPVLRSGAKAGDVVFVSGRLGGAWAATGRGVAPHLCFEPRLELAQTLARTLGHSLHSMIDLSDGLAADLGRICEMSNLAAEIDLAQVPIRTEAELAAGADGKPAWMHALGDGEDYELCFTVDAQAAENVPAEIDAVAITRVGRMIAVDRAPARGRVWLCHPDARREPAEALGWEHAG